MYIAVFNAKRSKRVDVFNRNYGLYSGLTTTFVVLFVVAASDHSHIASYWFIAVALLCGFGTWATGYDYAGELVLQFINLPSREGEDDDEVVAVILEE